MKTRKNANLDALAGKRNVGISYSEERRDENIIEKPIVFIHDGDNVRPALALDIRTNDGNEYLFTEGQQVYMNTNEIRILQFREKVVERYIFYRRNICRIVITEKRRDSNEQ